MSRLREHRVRMDTSPCPDPDGCARLFHGSLEAGLLDGDSCECCGQVVGDSPRVPSPREWKAARPVTVDDVAALYGVHAARPPASSLERVGWTVEHRDGSYGLYAPGKPVSFAGQPVRVRPVFAVMANTDEGG